MSSKTPGQRLFLVVARCPKNPMNRLHTAEVSGSNPVAPTPKTLVQEFTYGEFSFILAPVG